MRSFATSRGIATVLVAVSLALATETASARTPTGGDAGPAVTAATSATPDRLACTGYPERRVFLEGQAWWIRTPGKTGSSFGHMHVGACLPERQQISGVIAIDVRIILHDNPGEFDYLNPVLKSDSEEISLPHVTSLHGFTCPVGTCTAWVRLSVDTSLLSNDGFQEIRIRAYVDEPDGNIMHSSINTHAYFRNGHPVDDVSRRPYARGKGWYTDSGYCEASFVSAIPTAVIRGVWRPTVKIVHHGADDLDVTHHSLRIDPDFHADPVVPGTVVADGAGEFSEQQLAIDTTRLSDGKHRLVMRGDCHDPRGSTNSGVLVVPFIVDNAPPAVSSPTQGVPRLAGLTSVDSRVPILVSWSGSDAISGIGRYELYQSTDSGPFGRVATVGGSTTRYTRYLAPGSTRYQFAVRATDVAGNTSGLARGAPFTVRLLQENNGAPAPRYTAGWARQAVAGASGGYVRYARAAGSTVTLAFEGKTVAWVAVRGPDRGRADVYIDGTKVTSTPIDLYASTQRLRRIVFSRRLAVDGTHTVKIVTQGTKNASSTGTRIDVDAFVVIDQ